MNSFVKFMNYPNPNPNPNRREFFSQKRNLGPYALGISKLFGFGFGFFFSDGANGPGPGPLYQDTFPHCWPTQRPIDKSNLPF